MLDCLAVMEREYLAQFTPKFAPHPALGSMFGALSENVVPWGGKVVAQFSAEDLIERFPGRFRTYADWQHGTYVKQRPSIQVRTLLKRLSERGALSRRERAWRRHGGKITYSLKPAA